MMQTVFLQICTMFVLAFCGAVLYKTGKINDAGSKTIGNILIYLSLPCVIIKGFLRPKQEGEMFLLLVCAVLSFVLLVISTVISRLIYRKDNIAAFAGAYSNPGFFGIPIIAASVGSEAVFYVAPFVAFLNMFQWTYGTNLMADDKNAGKITLKKIVTAPFFVAICIGIVLYITEIQLPVFLENTVSAIANVNTPLSMFTIGIYLSQSRVLDMLKKKGLYALAAVRLLLIPIVVILIFSLLPSTILNEQMRMALIIASACPVGANVAIYADLYGKDKQYAAETVVISTLFSIITIPFILYVGSLMI